MIITVASYKGGVAKTMTAVHLAAYLQTLAPTLLLDSDQTKGARAWSEAGDGFPFKVAPVEQVAKLMRNYNHLVFDTGQKPSVEDLQAAAEGCDLLVIPTSPGFQNTNALGETIRALQQIPGANYRVLLTCVAPYEGGKEADLRKLLAAANVPVFERAIPRLEAFKKAEFAGCIVDKVKDPQAARAWAAYVAVGEDLVMAINGQRVVEMAVRA
jgi:chromosome partitioning protein